jgi:hypothetical protein
VQKSATTFDEQINAVSMDAIRDEIWSVCYALQNSLNSILCDPELDSSGKQSAMDTSIEQFATAMKEFPDGLGEHLQKSKRIWMHLTKQIFPW